MHGAPRKRVCTTEALDEDTRWVAKAMGKAAQGETPIQSGTFSVAPAARVVVMPLRAVGDVDPTVAHLMSGMLLTSLESVEGLSAVGKDDVEALLGLEEQRDLFGCDTMSCMAEIGGMLGADLVLHEELGRLGSSHALSLTLIDANDSIVRARVSRVLDRDVDTLVKALPSVVKELIARLNAP